MATRLGLRAKRGEVLGQLRRVAPLGPDGKRHVLDPAAIKWVLKRLDHTMWTPERIDILLGRLEHDRDGKIDCEAFVDAIYGKNAAHDESSFQVPVSEAEFQKKESELEEMARSNIALQEELNRLKGKIADAAQKDAEKDAELERARAGVARCREEVHKIKASEQHALDRLAQVSRSLPIVPRRAAASVPMSSKRSAVLMGSVLRALSKRSISNASDAFRFFAGGADVKEVPTDAFQRKLRGLEALTPEEGYFLIQSLDPEMLGVVRFRSFRIIMANFLSQSAEIHQTLPDDQYNALLIRIQRQLADKGLDVEDVFRDYQRDQDGCIGCREFVAGLRGAQIGLAEKELVQLFDALTSRLNGSKACCIVNSRAHSRAHSRASSKASSADSDPLAHEQEALPDGWERPAGRRSGVRRLSLDALVGALAMPSVAQSKLRDWAAHNFANLTQMSMKLLAQRHAEPPEFQRLYFAGFEGLLGELNPDLTTDEVCRLWALLNKDDDSKEPAVRVSLLGQMSQMRPGPEAGHSVTAPQRPSGLSGHPAPAAAVQEGVGRRRSGGMFRSGAHLLPEQRTRFGVLWGGLTPTTSSPALSLVGSPMVSPRPESIMLPKIVGAPSVGKLPRGNRSCSPVP